MSTFDLEWADSVTVDWVAANVDPAAALETYQKFNHMNNLMQEPAAWNAELGTWKRDERGEYMVLIQVPVLVAEPSEGDWEYALRRQDTQQYIAWMRQGYMPPPVELIRHSSDGHLLYLNRRRWLAARQVGIKNWSVWYGGYSCPEHAASGIWWLPEASDYYRNELKRFREICHPPERSFSPYVMRRLAAAGLV